MAPMSLKHETGPVRRQQIIDAARKLIILKGSEHVTIKGLAHEVGISEAAIYRHFNGKRDVMLLLVDDVGANLLNDIKDSGSKKGRDVIDRLNHILNRHISAIEQRRGVSFQVIAEIISLGDRGLNARVADIVDRYIARLKTLLEEGIGTGELRKDLNAEATAVLIFGLTQGVVNLWALNNYGFDLKKRYNTLWSTLRQTITGDGAGYVMKESKPK
ncbi:MAG: TetR/AcrR family transcriptional regulator [Dehalococcoidia bacterium]|nr:MAG: TetR/AcrR family transcriptional regulator [Dehalococcoidia bacterium]